MGFILPGYAMYVLNWYGRALRNRNWHDFLPDNLSTEDPHGWYWLYCYAAMRLIGMNKFAACLQAFIKVILRSLPIDWERSYAHLLRSLSAEDPMLSQLAHIIARQIKWYTLMLTDTDQCMIAEHFPYFAGAVEVISSGCQ
jgi:hypothetical protein